MIYTPTHVMVVDDEKDFNEMLAESLKEMDFSVLSAFSGKQCLALMEDNPVDVIVLDIKMPEMDGIETLTRVKKNFPLVEIIMLTGHGTIESAVKGMKLGAYDYLLKPADFEELVQKIKGARTRRDEHEERIRAAEAQMLKIQSRKGAEVRWARSCSPAGKKRKSFRPFLLVKEDAVMELEKIEIKNILYATDLSDSARYAFAYAVSLAEMYGAVITILHVLPEIPHLVDAHVIGYVGADRWTKIKQEHMDEAIHSLIGKRRDNVAIREILDRFAKSVQAEKEHDFVTDEIVVKHGNEAEQILAVSKERNCDLIVMGTHGLGGLVDVMLGSTARRVVRRSRIPVLVVRLKEEDSE